MKVKIIGYGVVGKNMSKILTEASIHDPAKGVGDLEYADVAFVCVPTEMLPDGSADTSIVESVIREHEAMVFCVKSTVPPGTCDRIQKETGKRIVFSPEYFGATEHANYHDYDFVTLGGEICDTSVVVEAYKKVCHPEVKFYFCNRIEAELVKYMENCWLAAKVTFCNEFHRIAERIGVNYDVLRELWLLDPRVNRSHTFVYRDEPYFDSHCLNKDVPALIAFCRQVGYNPELLEQILETNRKFKEVHNGLI